MIRLGIDFGTSTTVGMLATDDGRIRPLMFDGSPLLPSAVLANPDGEFLVGTDAHRSAAAAPSAFEGNPKRRIDDGVVWLAEREYAAADLIAAVLRRVAVEAARVAGQPPVEVVLTHPAAWGRARLSILADAASRAGLRPVAFTPEPVAAAAYFSSVLRQRVATGRHLVVYDLGAGTFDVTVVRRDHSGFTVAATQGLDDVGGLDLDAAIVALARDMTVGETTVWHRLDWPQSLVDRRARQTLWQDARAVKEQLSRHATGQLHLPLIDRDLHLTREEFEQAAAAHLERTAALTLEALRATGVPPEDVSGVFLVGGASRVPLAATLLHRALRIAPTIIDQPELVVAEGALHSRPVPTEVPTRPAAPTRKSPTAAPPPAAPTNRPATPPPVPRVNPAPTLRPQTGPPAGTRPSRRGLVAAGVAVAVLIVAVAVWRPWQDSASDRGAGNVGATTASGSPLQTLTAYVNAKFNQRDDGRAKALECANPGLADLTSTVDELRSLESRFAVTITTEIDHPAVTSSSATIAGIEVDLRVSIPEANGVRSTQVQRWHFDLTQDHGWRVCAAHRLS